MTTEMDHNSTYVSAPKLAKSRYNRQMLIPSISIQGQERILSTRVLIIGLGGLGSPASLYLAGAGVGTLGLLDHDVVEQSNLHRQVVHRESSVNPRRYSQSSPSSSLFDTSSEGESHGDGVGDGGSNPATTTTTTTHRSMTKVQSALRGCRELNSSIEYRGHEVHLNGSNALDIVRQYDIVLDCTDNPATRYLISDVCVVLGKILVSGAAQRLDGQVMVLNYPIPSPPRQSDVGVDDGEGNHLPGKESSASISNPIRPPATTLRGPCYRCVFPVPPSPEMVQGCSEIGILGPVVGTIGCLMASETLRLICRPDEPRKPTMLLYNAWSADPRSTFRTIGLRGQRPDCISCGDEKALGDKSKQKLDEDQIRHGTMDYQAFCGRVEDVKILNEKERIDASEFLKLTGSDPGGGGGEYLVVDVREQIEIEMGPKINNSTNIPISKILRGDGGGGMANGQKTASIWDVIPSHRGDDPIYFVCQKGNDSQLAARKLMDHTRTHQRNSRWIGDVRGGFVAMEQVQTHD